MKNWYLRHQRGAYYLWLGLGLAALLLADCYMLIRTGDVNMTGLLLPFILWVALGMALFLSEPYLRSRRAIAALNNDCDPTPLLDWADAELDYWSKRRAPKGQLALRAMNRAVALHALGRSREALAAAPEQGDLPQRGWLKPAYLLNMAVLQLALSHPLVASQYVRLAEKALAEHPVKSGPGKQLDYSLETVRCALRLADKKTDGLEARLQALLARADTQYQRVAAHLDLAKLALLEKRPEDARAHLGYVIEHGNKLALRNKAQEMLTRLS